MSYDIRLKDPVTEETAEVSGHLMIGGTYKADYHPETGQFTPVLNTEAWLNITYNYGCYYYEFHKEKGIRCIYGLCGLDSIAILNDIIAFLEGKYKRNGEWIYNPIPVTQFICLFKFMSGQFVIVPFNTFVIIAKGTIVIHELRPP